MDKDEFYEVLQGLVGKGLVKVTISEEGEKLYSLTELGGEVNDALRIQDLKNLMGNFEN